MPYVGRIEDLHQLNWKKKSANVNEQEVICFHSHTCQWNSMFLFPPLIWEHYMGINILFFCVSLPAWSFSLFILSKPLMKFWNAMLGWRVDVPATSWVLQTLLFAKGFLCLISPWDSGPVTPGIKIRLWQSVHKKKENITTPSPKYTF